MSTQKGNTDRKRPQKHQNKFAFKSALHDKTPQIKLIQNVELSGLCQRCKEVIDWKIKYKKYKPLTQPKKCTRCSQKRIKQAYYVICTTCATSSNICCKCLEKKEILKKPSPSTSEQMSEDHQFQQELEMLPERKRRTFLRLQASGKLTEDKIKELCADGDDDDFGFDDVDDLSDNQDNSDIDEDDENCSASCNEFLPKCLTNSHASTDVIYTDLATTDVIRTDHASTDVIYTDYASTDVIYTDHASTDKIHTAHIGVTKSSSPCNDEVDSLEQALIDCVQLN